MPPATRPVDLRVRLADRSLRQTNPVLGVVTELLELARAAADRLPGARPRRPRPGAPALPPRRRDLARLQDWIAQAGIRWGLDAATASALQARARGRRAPGQAGLERLLLGRDHDRGRPAAVRRGAAARRRGQPGDRARRAAGRAGRAPRTAPGRARAPASRWPTGARRSRAAADALTATAAAGALAARRAAAASSTRSSPRPATRRPRPSSPRPRSARCSAGRLEGRPTRANFRTGHLTVCTLMPMRSVPHRVVCLLGLDDGAFPRKAPRDGDDLMLDASPGRRARPAQRGPPAPARRPAGRHRAADRHLHRQRRAHQRARPPAVPVGELLDAIDATVPLDAAPRTAARRATRS